MNKLAGLCAFFISVPFLAEADPVRALAGSTIRQSIGLEQADLEFSAWGQGINGGYLARFELDCNSDGTPERFITSTVHGEKLLWHWSVVEGLSNEMLSGSAIIRPDGFWWNSATRTILYYQRLLATEGRAVTVSFNEGSIKTASETCPPSEFEAGLQKSSPPREGYTRFSPSVSCILLADYVKNQKAPWTRVDFEDVNSYDMPESRFALSADLPRKAALESFLPMHADVQLAIGPAAAAPSQPVNSAPAGAGESPAVERASPSNGPQGKGPGAASAEIESKPSRRGTGAVTLCAGALLLILLIARVLYRKT